ncbi:MAG: PKD domain-containing protein [Polyangiaceae bacterium]|nr:PKD domain-containing protein [Polyangiaceae bacterium]
MHRLLKSFGVSPRMLMAFVSALGISTFACTHDVTSPPSTGSESLAVKAAAADPSTPPASEDITFNLVYPAGYNIGQVAVGASGSLSLGSNDVILGVDGKPGAVTSAGIGATSLSPSVQAGDVVSVPDISISPKDTVTSARSSGKVSVGSNAKVGTVEQKASLTPLVQRTVTVHPPEGPSTDVDVSKKAPVSLAAGRYGQVTVGPDATLKLSAGTYLFDSFSVGPKAVVDLDTTDGTVNVYVNQSADWKGAVTGDASRFVFGYLGTDTIHLTGTFRGTALAPNGGLKIELEGASNEGTFYGKDVTVGPNITIKKLGTPFLIGELKVSSDDICIGEQTEVSLTATEPGATTRIMGVVGNHQFVDFAHIPGPRTIYATVETADGRADFVSIPINTRACAETPTSRVALSFRGAGGALNSAEFMVRGYDDKGNYVDVVRPASYVWDFGDGTKATTTTPLITHDYSASVDALKEYNSFNVSVTVTNSQGTMTTKKVVPLWSLYAKNRSKGIIQPPSTVSALTSWAYSLQVKNHEPTPISITAARPDFIPCDTNQDVQPQPVQAMNVAIPASATTTVNVTPPTTIPDDVCALGVHLMGTAPSGTVYSDVYIRARENPQLQAVTDPTAIALLNEASAVTQDPNHFDAQELRALVAAGKLSAVPPAMEAPATGPLAMKTAAATLSSGTAGHPLGSECTPGEVSDVPGLVCQPTVDWVADPGQILNASKGHILIDHGCGTIGKLLGAIHQNYSHTMIMSQNRSQVRHSTASEDRMQNALQVTRLRLDPDAVRYGFPGTSGKDTYNIDQMVTQYYVTDPDGKQWRMGAELSPGPVVCSDGDTRFTAVPTLVIKPTPDAPVDLQNAVATMADPENGALFTTTGHYRFFMYSRADEASLYPGAGWAENTRATVCSSFARDAAIGTMFNRQPLSLYPTNPDNSPTRQLPDGMHPYTVDERRAAANEQYANIHNAVAEACESTGEEGGGLLGGVVGTLFGGPVAGIFAGVIGGKAACGQAESNIANQVTNCFAFDGCDDTSDRWKNPGPGIAVSPDNILAWDVPASGGTYGYNEAVMYLPEVYRHRYVWKQTEGTGKLVIHVRDESSNPDNPGNPFPNARVYLNSNFVGLTPSTGDPDSIELSAIAPGTYDVEAQFNPCGENPQPVTEPHLPVSALSACEPGTVPSASGCTIKKPLNCPGDYIERDCEVRTNGDFDTALVCGCYPKPELACDMPMMRGNQPAVVYAGQTTEITIRLCAAGTSGCAQSCRSDGDCKESALYCKDLACTARPSLAKIAGDVLVQAYDNDLLVNPSRRQYSVSFHLTCDPFGSGVVDYTYCAQDSGGDDTAQFEYHATCVQDSATGGITMENSAWLAEGCGSGAQKLDNVVTWTTGLPSNPPDASGIYSVTQTAGSCWGTKVLGIFGSSDACAENSASFSLTYVNLMQQP